MVESESSEPKPGRRASRSANGASSHSATERGLPQPLTLAALVIAVVAVVLAIIGWFRPSTGPGKFGETEVQEAKARICAVTLTVRQGMGINTHRENPVPDDPLGELGVMANARLALYGGGAYLRGRLQAEPATPADVAQAAGALADTMQELAINYMAGANPEDSVQAPLRNKVNEEMAELDHLCEP